MSFFKSKANKHEFTWEAQKSGPSNYPMEMLSGKLYFKGSDTGLPIPTGTSWHKWGRGAAHHAEVTNKLPDRLEVTFYSYSENQTYHGIFKLPYDALVEQFQWGVDNPLPRFNMKMAQFNKFVVGIAPGGSVGLWIGGPSEQREVFFGQAEPIDMSLSSVFVIPFRSEAEAEAFRVRVLQKSVSAEQFEHIQTHGVPFDIWQRYRVPYHWLIEAAPSSMIADLRVTHINGVINSRQYDYSLVQYLPIPDTIGFIFSARLYEGFLDDYETIAAFEELATAAEGLEPEEQLIHIEITPNIDLKASTIRLYNAKHSIELKKVLFK